MRKFLLWVPLAAVLTAVGGNEVKGNAVRKIVFTGDSIACGVGASKKENRFSTVTVKLLNQSAGREAYREVNFAVSGSTMTDQPWPGAAASGYPHQLKRAIAAKPDIVVVQHGVNDNAIGCSLAGYAWSYRQFIRELRAALPDAVIVCMTITPTDRKGEGARQLDLQNAAIQEIAAKEKTLLMHTAEALNDSVEHFPDHLHPNDTGHRIIAETLAGVIEKNRPMSEEGFDLYFPHPGVYHVCGYVITIPRTAEGATRFRGMGKDDWSYSSRSRVSVTGPLLQYRKAVSCRSDAGEAPKFQWHAYHRKGIWDLPSTDGKEVKITVLPAAPDGGPRK